MEYRVDYVHQTAFYPRQKSGPEVVARIGRARQEIGIRNTLKGTTFNRIELLLKGVWLLRWEYLSPHPWFWGCEAFDE